ncbi:BadF/BadG/BcrA/BcrD ATPase family protein [Microbacterium tumbae]
MSTGQRIAGVDLGKTQCRLVITDGTDRRRADGAGSPGLATSDGVETALAAVLPLLREAGGAVEGIAVGAAGAWAAPAAAERLARELAVQVGAPAVVASDVVTAHAGALVGAPGVLLIAGTGAAALGIDARGARLVDGWGPELGDLGSGSWLGREGMRATLRQRSGLGPATVLTETALRRIGPADDVHAWLAGDEPIARRLAAFAPDVLDAAAGGDAVAAEIAADAVRLLTATAVAAADGASDVVLHGGLTNHPWFRALLADELLARGCTVATAGGDAVAGALLLATRTDLPHERYLHRAG